MSKELTIPYEVADKIALSVMQDHLNYLKQEVKSHVEEGAYMHPNDYHESMTRLIPALETMIKYFGGEV